MSENSSKVIRVKFPDGYLIDDLDTNFLPAIDFTEEELDDPNFDLCYVPPPYKCTSCGEESQDDGFENSSTYDSAPAKAKIHLLLCDFRALMTCILDMNLEEKELNMNEGSITQLIERIKGHEISFPSKSTEEVNQFRKYCGDVADVIQRWSNSEQPAEAFIQDYDLLLKIFSFNENWSCLFDQWSPYFCEMSYVGWHTRPAEAIPTSHLIDETVGSREPLTCDGDSKVPGFPPSWKTWKSWYYHGFQKQSWKSCKYHAKCF